MSETPADTRANGHESDDKPTPRQLLEAFLEGEPAGSIKFLGLGDRAAYTATCAEILLHKRKASVSTIDRMNYDRHIADLAVVARDIRNRQLGSQAAGYNVAFQDEEIWGAYAAANQAHSQHHSDIKAAGAMLSDLIEINNQISGDEMAAVSR